ncbi:unnamed protein product [Spirodela intermedia]|uniref:Uncharacterized protein n=1 Tax=Spirodela intermedia TaxID=51605 RepID=A0A7I8LER7_SPIIN|nr:unnamed protein product [Spirodela intermedia]
MAAKTAIAALFLAAAVAEYATVTVADASTECPYPCLPPPTGVTYYPSPPPPPPPQQPFPNYYYSPPPPSTPYTPGINVPGVMPYLPAAPPPPSQIVPYFPFYSRNSGSALLRLPTALLSCIITLGFFLL